MQGMIELHCLSRVTWNAESLGGIVKIARNLFQ